MIPVIRDFVVLSLIVIAFGAYFLARPHLSKPASIGAGACAAGATAAVIMWVSGGA